MFCHFSTAATFQGTNGGVTVVGLISSLLGALVIGAAYYLGIFMAASQVDLDFKNLSHFK